MGYLKERYGMTLCDFGSPEGTCPICSTEHPEELPHNPQSLAYQYRFYDANGRFPTWRDAMSHCSDEVKEAWTSILAEKGVSID